jgi:hypothetical protein
VTPVSRVRMSASVGYRKLTDDPDPTISYSTSLRRTGIFSYEASLTLSLFGFDGVSEHGTGYTVRVQLPNGRIGTPYASVAGYSYSVNGQTDSRRSTCIEIGTTIDFSQSLYLGGSTEWSVGDDIDGLRALLELGYRY